MTNAASGHDGVDSVVNRCVELLLDDYERQGRHLSVDDVTRVLSRRSPAPEKWNTVWERLAALGVQIEGVDCELPAECIHPSELPRDSKRKSNGARNKYKSELDYPDHSLLDHAREILLARRYQAARNVGDCYDPTNEEFVEILESGQKAREELILSNIRLVFACANRFTTTLSMSKDDLVQEGIIGLFRATERYNPEQGYRFSTYATWWINQSIQRALVDRGHCIRVPVHVSDKIKRLAITARKLALRYGRTPTANELADELGYEIGAINFLLQIKQEARYLKSAHDANYESTVLSLTQKYIEAPDAHLEREELKELVEIALKSLDARIRRILIYRFGLLGNKPRTLEQVGRKLGITRERVRQIEKKALLRIASSWRAGILRPYAE